MVYQGDIYEMYHGYTWDIYLYNLDSQTESRVTNNTANQVNPAVFGGRIVYMDDRNGNSDIYMTMVSYAPELGTGPIVGGPPPTASIAPDYTWYYIIGGVIVVIVVIALIYALFLRPKAKQAK